ncbi:SDR family oxidoreductase [Chitinasiproducens palmae]|uniref:3-oxoacyl-[acyl-carrier protein] reductase n=1 Tax=Chitinasiproducens palmae TaxID=1770053 RepID=A0A1H2PUS5_9BURK|nr:SDR family oxidoreductase [Chitinasiproducens palmae]SDV50604.1 3-oxoacyl-[acyl-carrier protein] reductase [Chitinasiproducens palmae]
MDLGITGRTALVCASSRGLGLACATALAREGCRVFINGRDAGALEAAAHAIEHATGVRVQRIVADLNTEAGRAALIAACPEPDILVNNNAGPEPGKIADWTREDWLGAVEANMLAPVFLIKTYLPGMRSRRFGRIVNITSAMVKSPSATMGLSAAVRAGLTALSKSVQRDSVVDNVTINNMLPERFDTDRQRYMADRMSQRESITVAEAKQRIAATIAAKRLGQPSEFGDACAFLCSAQAGFISGQNLQLDGGSYAGLV